MTLKEAVARISQSLEEEVIPTNAYAFLSDFVCAHPDPKREIDDLVAESITLEARVYDLQESVRAAEHRTSLALEREEVWREVFYAALGLKNQDRTRPPVT